MKEFEQKLSSKEILEIVGGELIQNKSVFINSIGDLMEADNNSVAFYNDEKYREKFKNSDAGLIFIPSDSLAEDKSRNYIIIEQPYYAFLKVIDYFLKSEKRNKIDGQLIADSAGIHSSVKLPQNVKIGSNVIIGKNSTIGDLTEIEDNTVIGAKVGIGSKTHIYPGVIIYHDCKIGDRVNIHSGTVIGSDGFGYLWDGKKQRKIPQIGRVIIEDEVELGSNVSVDRGALGNTIIREDTKIDNLVQIGHNVEIGKHTIICSQTGIAGSSKVGNNVTLAGQVGVADHVTIGDDVTVAAMSGISNDVPDGKIMFGYPATEAGKQKRIIASMRSLPKLRKILRRLQKRIDD